MADDSLGPPGWSHGRLALAFEPCVDDADSEGSGPLADGPSPHFSPGAAAAEDGWKWPQASSSAPTAMTNR